MRQRNHGLTGLSDEEQNCLENNKEVKNELSQSNVLLVRQCMNLIVNNRRMVLKIKVRFLRLYIHRMGSIRWNKYE